MLRPDETGTLIAANFWLAEGVDDPDGAGYERYDTAKKMLAEKNYTVTEKEAMNILDAVHHILIDFVCIRGTGGCISPKHRCAYIFITVVLRSIDT